MGENDTVVSQKLARGDRRAFEQVYETYHRELYSMARLYLRDPGLAEDAVQEIFVKLWHKREILDPSQSVRGYLFTMMKNHLLNTLRNRKKTIVSTFIVEEACLPGYASTEQEVIGNDYQQILHEGLQYLPDRKREIFELKTLGHSNDQIASMLVISVNTVKTQYYHGLKFIRSYLRKHAEL